MATSVAERLHAAGVPLAAIQNPSHILHVPIDLVAGGEH